ncbi:MAG: hypothetical protein O9327_03465 [Polaromonas sp.]|nr:hypothetical protein [Polaromonas sp.]
MSFFAYADNTPISNPADADDGMAWAHQSPHYKPNLVALPEPNVVARALASDATARRVRAKGASIQEGDAIGVRLNLNIAKSTGVLVHTLHQGTKGDGYTRGRGLWNGGVLGYAEFVVLRDAYFNVSQAGREAIAAGQQSKFPMASIDGRLANMASPAKLTEVLGVEISFNPKSVHLFVDPEGRAVRFAEEVTIVGHRAYARGRLEYFTPATAPARQGDAPSRAHFGPIGQRQAV